MFVIGRVVFEEDAVGKLWQSLLAPAHPEDRLHLVVIGREIRVADRPVGAKAVVIFGLEFIVAQAEGHSRPEERLAADHPHAHPVVGLLRIVRVWNLGLIHPLIGVEFIRLNHVRQPSRLAEPAVGELVDGFGHALAREIDQRAGIQHQAGDPLLGQCVGGHTTGCPGADDKNIVFFRRHWVSSISNRWEASTD